jgi:hypothetical protein
MMKTCDHCGRQRQIMASLTHADGPRMYLCHPNQADHPIFERNGTNPDCYRLVTIYREPIGSRKAPTNELA